MLAPPAAASGALSLCGNAGPAPQSPQHVVVVMMENLSYNSVVGSPNSPYQTSLANQCGVATSNFGATHASAANYLAVSSGDYPSYTAPGCGTIAACADPEDNLYHQLSNAASSWAGYIESMPSNCDPKSSGTLTKSHDLYSNGHNPVIFFTDIPKADCQANDIGVPDLTSPSGSFWNALQSQTLPAFSFVTPNAANNDQGTGTKAHNQQAADTWVQKFIGLVQQSNSYQAGNTLVLVTYDEGAGSDEITGEDCTNKALDLPVTNGVSAHQDSCHVPLFVVDPYTPAGDHDPTFFDHYSITKTVEQLFGLPYLAHAADAQTNSLVGSFGITAGVQPPPPPPPPPPTVSVAAPVAGASVSGPLVVSGTAVDGAGVSEVDASVDGGTWQLASGAAAWSWGLDTTGLSNGPHTILVRATDSGGRVGTASVSVMVNNTPPDLPPVAAGSGSCTNLACGFDGSGSSDSDGSVASYSWDFGDGTSGTGEFPVHTYASAGPFTYSLTVTDNQGLSSLPIQGKVTATAPPDVPPVAAGSGSCTNLACAFDGSGSSDWDGSVASYSWDFGDGTSGTGEFPNHTYASPGPSTYSLTVTDNQGVSSAPVQGTVTATPPPPPDVPPVAAGSGSCTNLACAFDGSGSSDSDGSVASYSWDFGDGTSGTGEFPNHTYALSGTYTYWLTVTDNQGVSSLPIQGTVAATAPPDVPPVAAPSGSCTNLACTFNGSGSSDSDGSVASYSWDFGDGTSGTGEFPNHTYASAGPSTYWLTVTDNQGISSVAVQGTVTPTAPPDVPPVAVPKGSCTNLACTFNGSGSSDSDGSVASYSWNFGDGSSGSGEFPNHPYASGGTYNYSLTVTDNDGVSSTPVQGTVTATLPDVPPVAAGSGSCSNLVCGFNGSGSSDVDGSVASYSWDFGDGSSGAGEFPSHTYSSPGTYTYSLTVTDDQGLTSLPTQGIVTATAGTTHIGFVGASHSYAKSATVTSGASLSAPSTIHPGDTELLVVSTPVVGATGTPAGWTLVGQQSSSPLQTTIYEHTATPADVGATVSVPVTAASAVSLQLADYTGASATVTATGAVDSGTASHATPKATVTAPGSWVVSSWTDKSSTTTAWNLPAGVTSRDTVIGTSGGHVAGALADSGQPVAVGSYPAQTATVVGGASGKGVTFSLVLQPQNVAPDKPPVAAASASCAALTCSFDGSASSDPDGSVASYAWTFGDGSSGTGKTATHSYAGPGTYPYTLTVTDNQGVAGIALQGTVTATAPTSAPIGFGAASDVYQKSAKAGTPLSVTQPGGIHAGDTELLFVSSTVVGATGTPAGWTQVAQQSSSPLQATVYRHVVAANDPGGNVSVPVSAAAVVAAQLVDYGSVGSGVTASAASDSGAPSHVTPAQTVTSPGSWVVSYWADKSTTTTGLTLPGGLASRDVTIGSGGGHIVAAVADSGGVVPTGSYPSQSAGVVGGASAKGVMVGVVLPPKS
jgi:PKD repeat protein